MSQAANRPETSDGLRGALRARRQVVDPFAGMIEAVIVEDPAMQSFAGCIPRRHAAAAWIWVYRDLCPDLINPDTILDGTFNVATLEPLLPQVITRIKDSLFVADTDTEAARRLKVMLGGEEARDAVPVLLNALRARPLLAKAQLFGKAINAMGDDAALGVALQSMPLQDPPLAALLFHAALTHIANPTRLVTAVIKLSGNATETAVARSGYAPVVDAILAHAQNQLHRLQPNGAFADVDLMCRALERFHRLVRSLTGYIEFTRGSRWSTVLAAIVKQVSDRIEPRLREIVPDINLAMRRAREGVVDRLDNDRILAAMNGVYLLSTMRDCRDSLALNAIFDLAWSQSEEALELHLQRNLDLLRQNPADQVISARLDAGIKMAEIRFNPEYAETLRRARAAAERRG